MKDEENPLYHKDTDKPDNLDSIKKLEDDSLENSAKSDMAEQTTEASSLTNGGFYRSDADETEYKIKGSTRKKTGIGIGIVALLTGGGIGLFGFLAQPLQLIQMSSMLRNFHFSDGENLGDDRMMKLGRYLRYGGDERTRLSVLGNKYANRLEARLNKSGLKSTYDGPRNTFSGYLVDTKELKSSKTLGDIEGKTPEQIRSDLSARYGIDASQIDIKPEGKLVINTKGLNTLETKRLLRTSLEDAGYSKIGAAMRARIMGKRAGVSWNPIKKLDTNITASVEARIKDFFEARKKRISSGTDTDLFKARENPDGQQDTNNDGTPDSNPDAKNAADGANDLKSGPGTPEENIKSKLGKVGGGLAVIGAVCAVKGLAQQYDYIKHDNIVLPLMRLGVEGLAVGNQVVTGQNLDPVQVDAMTKLMYDKEAKNSWRSAKSIQYEAGDKNLTGPDIGDEAKLDANGNVFTQVINQIPLIDSVCKVASSALGNIVDIGLTLLSGPLEVVTDQFQSIILGKLGGALIGWLAGNPINVNVSGANYGNYINYGARLAANDSFISGGGRQLTNAEVAELRNNRLQEENYDFSKKSTLAKLFDATDYRTPLGRFVSEQATDPKDNIARVANIFPRTISSIFSINTNLFVNRAGAAETYDYGFAKYGFSATEANSKAIENPFENDAYVATLLDTRADEFNKATTTCFGIKIVKKTFGNKDVWSPESVGEVPKYVDISKEPKCTDTSEEFLRVRMWIHDTQMMSSYACFEDGAENTCAEFGLAPENGQSGGGTSSTIISSINCDGYSELSSVPASLSSGMPTNIKQVPYSFSVSGVCQNIKNQCAASVANTSKILCSALEFHDSWYGNTYSKINGVYSYQYYYGLSTINSALYDTSRWYDSRTPGINSNNLLDCSALTAVALYRAYSYSSPIGCSGNWGQSKRPDLFKAINWSDIQPGDFLTYSSSCNSDGFGHIAIAASNVASDGSFVVFEQSRYGTTAHFRLANKNTWGLKDGAGLFSGNLSRWIGPGAN